MCSPGQCRVLHWRPPTAPLLRRPCHPWSTCPTIFPTPAILGPHYVSHTPHVILPPPWPTAMPPCHHGPLQHPSSPVHCPSAVVPPHPPPHRHCGSPCSRPPADGTLAWPTTCPTFHAGAARSCVGWPTWLSILNFLNNSHLFVTKISVINFNHRPMPPFFVVIIIVLSLKLDDNSKANCYRNLSLKYFGDKCYLITNLDVKAFVTENFGDKFGTNTLLSHNLNLLSPKFLGTKHLFSTSVFTFRESTRGCSCSYSWSSSW